MIYYDNLASLGLASLGPASTIIRCANEPGFLQPIGDFSFAFTNLRFPHHAPTHLEKGTLESDDEAAGIA
jgi:hypothetical protein